MPESHDDDWHQPRAQRRDPCNLHLLRPPSRTGNQLRVVQFRVPRRRSQGQALLRFDLFSLNSNLWIFKLKTVFSRSLNLLIKMKLWCFSYLVTAQRLTLLRGQGFKSHEFFANHNLLWWNFFSVRNWKKWRLINLLALTMITIAVLNQPNKKGIRALWLRSPISR